MHAMFQSGDVIFLASDCMGEQPAQIGNNISMTLNFTDETEQTRLFNALAEGGKITMPLDDAFWGARFGMVMDQFGIQWLFNLPKTA
jgi:PhnB protein